MRRNKKVKSCFVVLVMFLAACLANANDYFIATDGNDLNDGSIDHPFKTIPRGVTAAWAGDTIYLRGGVHNYSSTIQITKSGTSGNLITLQNYQGETVIVDFSAQQRISNYRGIELTTGGYWHFKGFTVRYSADNGIYVNSSYNIFEQMVFHENGDSGLQLYANATGSPAYNQIINCDSYLNYDPYANGENADGFAAKGPTGGAYSLGPGNVYWGCRSWSNSDDGWDLWYAGNDVAILNCWAFYNGINVWGISPFNGDGQGIKLGQGTGGHTVINCLSYGNQHRGFDRNGNTSGGITIYNCTSVGNIEKNFYFNDTDPTHTYVLRNNISHLGSVTISAQTDDEYNTWNSGFSVGDADFASLDANGLSAPRGPDGSLPKIPMFRLARASALIDAGIDVGQPYHYSAPDLGAFEHIDGDCQPDGEVDWLDIQCLADNWLASGCGNCNGADFDGDSGVNAIDFAVVGENWLK